MTDGPQQRPLFALVIRLGAALVLSLMLVFVKLLGESGVHLLEILFWRQVVTIPILGAWFYFSGRMLLLSTDRMALHGKRAAYGIIGMVLNFAGVLLLPLAEATTFNFTSVLWAVVLSAMLLQEKVGPYRWASVMLGFAGVLVIAQPGGGNIPLFGAAVSLGAAFMIALISIQIRDLGKTENPLTIVFYFSAFTTPVLALAMPFVAQQHTAYQWGLLAGLALFGILGQFLLTAALRLGSVATVIVMDYSALIWATVFGWVIFDQLPPAATWIGAPLIIAAGITIAWREHYLAKLRKSDLETRRLLAE